MAQINKQTRPYVVYSLLAVAVMLPMLAGGYIFALDMAFTPQLRMPEHMSSSYLFHAALHYLNLVIPSQILQKILLFSILLLSGVGMHYVVQHIQKTKNEPRPYDEWAKYIAGSLYMINPFTYSRFMAGQYAVLLGYALLPFFVRAALRFFAVPTIGRGLAICAWAIGISIVSVHTLGMAAIVLVVGFIGHAWRCRDNCLILGKGLVIALGSGLLFVVASGYWLFPMLQGTSNQGQAIATFDSSDRAAFATTGDTVVDKLGNVLQLQGFWAEGQGLYLLPGEQMPGWPLVVLLVWVLVGCGAVWLWRQQRAIAAVFIGTTVVAIAIAIFGAGDWSVLNGFREPQKFVALVAVSYALFAGLGAGAILGRVKKSKNEVIFAIVAVPILLLPVAFTPTMFWGFSGQLAPRQYPADWFAMNKRLNQDKSEFKVLFLPWHLYTHFPFAGRVVVNPADKFFDKPTIISNELEFGGAAPTFPDNDKETISHILKAAPTSTNLGAQLADLDIKYILLAKNYDYKTYDYLQSQTDVVLVAETPNLRLYRSLVHE